MGMLSRQLSAEPTMNGRGPLADFWYQTFGRKVTSGVMVDQTTALNYSAVWAATRLIAETIATLPRVMYQRTPTGKTLAVGHPTFKMFKSEPNREQSGVNHWSQQIGFMVNWGDSFAEIVRDGLGRVREVWPIHASRLPAGSIRRDASGELVYHVRNNDGSVTPIQRSEMFHIPGILSEDGVRGRGVIVHGAESIGMGIATEQFGAAFFGNGAGPAVVMTHPKTLGPEAADNLRRSWHRRYSGPNRANGMLVLEEGTTITPITIPPEQAQFLGTRQFNITEIARWYNLPVHMLREMSKSSFSNIESESLNLVVFSLMPWITRIEDECNRQLLLEEEKDRYFFKFQLQGLLRGDMAARSAFYKEMFMMGVFSINDILELEDRNPIGPMGDVRMVPANMMSLEKVYNASKQPEVAPIAIESTAPGGVVAADSKEAAATGDVQATALNGAQIAALQAISTQLSVGELPPDGTRSMLKVSFPLMDRDEIDVIISDLAKFAKEQDKKEPPPTERDAPPFGGPPAQPGGNADNPPLSVAPRDTALAAARALFVEAFGRLAAKEQKGALWAAQKPKLFMSRLDEFFERHRKTYVEQIDGPLGALSALGVECSIGVFAESQLTEAYSELLELSGTTAADGLSELVGTWAEQWGGRAEIVADRVFAGEFIDRETKAVAA